MIGLTDKTDQPANLSVRVVKHAVHPFSFPVAKSKLHIVYSHWRKLLRLVERYMAGPTCRLSHLPTQFGNANLGYAADQEMAAALLSECAIIGPIRRRSSHVARLARSGMRSGQFLRARSSLDRSPKVTAGNGAVAASKRRTASLCRPAAAPLTYRMARSASHRQGADELATAHRVGSSGRKARQAALSGT